MCVMSLQKLILEFIVEFIIKFIMEFIIVSHRENNIFLFITVFNRVLNSL